MNSTIKNIMRYGFLWGILFFVLSASALTAQTLELFTTSSGGGRILLIWSPDSVTPNVRYNIYRKEASEPSWPGTPLNPTPIGPLTNCTEFKTFIPSGSDLWTMLSYGLADSTGGVLRLHP